MSFLFGGVSASSAIGSRASVAGFLGRAMRHRRFKSPTPPTWYQKHALMFGQYEIEGDLEPTASGIYKKTDPVLKHTSLAPVRQCHVYEKELWSMILQKSVRFKISAAALREIDRKGGLDEYILLTSDEELGGTGSVGVIFKRGLERALKQRNEMMAASNQPTDQENIETSQEIKSESAWWKNKVFSLNVASKKEDLGHTARESLHPQFWERLEAASNGNSRS